MRMQLLKTEGDMKRRDPNAPPELVKPLRSKSYVDQIVMCNYKLYITIL